MKSVCSPAPLPASPLRKGENEKDYSSIQNYYDVAGPDYEIWSKNFNMHFGYARSFSDIFFLERMLENMSNEVITELQLPGSKEAIVADLGCGVGAVSRFAAESYPLSNITGYTISQYQVEKARALNISSGLGNQITILNDNFENLSCPDETYTHAYALESACHAGGDDKELFIRELSRVLKTGGRFCIADGFLKTARTTPPLFNFLCKKVTNFWAVPCFAKLEAFEKTLHKYGLKDIRIREISWRIAPSVMYVPWTCLKFFATELWRNKSLRMKKERWNNVYAPVLGMFLGLYRRHFGYYIISGCKD